MLSNLYLGAIGLAQQVNNGTDRISNSRNQFDDTAPGQAQLTELIGTIRSWAIIACVLAIIIAAIIWAWGSQSQNAAQATQGKKGMIIAVAAAAIIFAAEPLIDWGIRLGSGVRDGG